MTALTKSARCPLCGRIPKQLLTRCILFLSIALHAGGASAFNFFSANGTHPLSGLVGIPQAHFLTTEPEAHLSGNSLSNSDVAISIQSDYSNIFAGGARDGEFVRIDGETARTTVAIVSRIGACFQLAADFAHVAHSGGSLDNIIEKWHEFFQLPNAQRNQTEADRLSIVYESGDSSLRLENETQSLGDTTLQIAYHSDCGVGDFSLPGALWFTGATLPTGNLEDLSGSDELGIFFGFQGHSLSVGKQLTMSSRWGLFLPPDISGALQTSSLIAFGNIGMHWHPDWLMQHNLRLMLQVDMHSPLFTSVLRELGNYTAQLVVGGKWTLSKYHEFSVAFLEDIAIDTAPDLVFHFRYRFAF